MSIHTHILLILFTNTCNIIAMINIVGVGRSGTNMIGKLLDSHNDITCDIEVEAQFQYSLNVVNYNKDYDKLIKIYKDKLLSVNIYATKDHTNLWIADRLKLSFPNIIFIGIYRNVYQTVASSLLHKGVLSWFNTNLPLSGYPYPKPVSLIEKITYRIIKHYEKLNEMKIYLINYTDFCNNTQQNLNKLELYLGLKSKFQMPIVYNTSNKYKKVLSASDIRLIDRAVSLYSNF